MQVHRTTWTTAYVVLGTEAGQDNRLSLTARGLLWYCLSHYQGCPLTIDEIADLVTDSRERVRRSMRELVAAGYAVHVRVADPETGRFRTETHVYDRPFGQVEPNAAMTAAGVAASALAGNRTSEASSQVAADAGSPASGGELDGEGVSAGRAERRPNGAQTPSKKPQVENPPPLVLAEASAAWGTGEGREGGDAQSPNLAEAIRILRSLRETDARLVLTVGQAAELGPTAAQWLDRGASSAFMRQELTVGLPAEIRSAVRLIGRRLADKMPQEARRATVAPLIECDECRAPVPTRAADGLCVACRGVQGQPGKDLARIAAGASLARATFRASLGR